MIWFKRLLIILPFVMAVFLNILVLISKLLHLNNQHIEGYGFLFGAPWGWLTDRGWFEDVHIKWIKQLVIYLIILWIPACLYSGSIWLGFKTVSGIKRTLLDKS